MTSNTEIDLATAVRESAPLTVEVTALLLGYEVLTVISMIGRGILRAHGKGISAASVREFKIRRVMNRRAA